MKLPSVMTYISGGLMLGACVYSFLNGLFVQGVLYSLVCAYLCAEQYLSDFYSHKPSVEHYLKRSVIQPIVWAAMFTSLLVNSIYSRFTPEGDLDASLAFLIVYGSLSMFCIVFSVKRAVCNWKIRND